MAEASPPHAQMTLPDPDYAAPAFRNGKVDRDDLRRLINVLQEWRNAVQDWKLLVDSRLDQARDVVVALRDRVVVLEGKELELRSRVVVAEAAVVDLQNRVGELEARP